MSMSVFMLAAALVSSQGEILQSNAGHAYVNSHECNLALQGAGSRPAANGNDIVYACLDVSRLTDDAAGRAYIRDTFVQADDRLRANLNRAYWNSLPYAPHRVDTFATIRR